MPGMVVTITEMMEIGQIKNKIKNILVDKKKTTKYFRIAMIALTAIIAIILIDILYIQNANAKKSVNQNAFSNIHFEESNDEKINKFITDYFRARHMLNFPKIFSSYGRDYYKELREDKIGSVKKIIENIRYEKTFVMNYDNIKVYKTDGYREDEIVCVVTYDLLFGFTNEVAPMIIIFYLEKNGESYIINDKFDVGTSKYIMACMNTPEIKAVYNDVKTRLTRNLVSDEGLKLSYNSLRQFEMNMNGELNYEKVDFLENYGIRTVDPVNDVDKIRDYIITKKKTEENEMKLNDFLDKIKASISEIG